MAQGLAGGMLPGARLVQLRHSPGWATPPAARCQQVPARHACWPAFPPPLHLHPSLAVQYPYFSTAALSPQNPFFTSDALHGCGQCFQIMCADTRSGGCAIAHSGPSGLRACCRG